MAVWEQIVCRVWRTPTTPMTPNGKTGTPGFYNYNFPNSDSGAALRLPVAVRNINTKKSNETHRSHVATAVCCKRQTNGTIYLSFVPLLAPLRWCRILYSDWLSHSFRNWANWTRSKRKLFLCSHNLWTRRDPCDKHITRTHAFNEQLHRKRQIQLTWPMNCVPRMIWCLATI